MRIFVTGGTGLIGSAAAAERLSNDHTVLALARAESLRGGLSTWNRFAPGACSGPGAVNSPGFSATTSPAPTPQRCPGQRQAQGEHQQKPYAGEVGSLTFYLKRTSWATSNWPRTSPVSGAP